MAIDSFYYYYYLCHTDILAKTRRMSWKTKFQKVRGREQQEHYDANLQIQKVRRLHA